MVVFCRIIPLQKWSFLWASPRTLRHGQCWTVLPFSQLFTQWAWKIQWGWLSNVLQHNWPRWSVRKRARRHIIVAREGQFGAWWGHWESQFRRNFVNAASSILQWGQSPDKTPRSPNHNQGQAAGHAETDLRNHPQTHQAHSRAIGKGDWLDHEGHSGKRSTWAFQML